MPRKPSAFTSRFIVNSGELPSGIRSSERTLKNGHRRITYVIDHHPTKKTATGAVFSSITVDELDGADAVEQARLHAIAIRMQYLRAVALGRKAKLDNPRSWKARRIKPEKLQAACDEVWDLVA